MNDFEFSMTDYQFVLRNDFSSFIERSFAELNPQTDFMTASYIDLLASTLEGCRTGKMKRLIINLPPRTLKSHAASVAFPAWLLGHHPAKEIICASYGQDLADKHARDSRTLMSSAFYKNLFPKTVLAPDKTSVGDFMTTAKGGRMATSVGGVLTGRGGDVLILDDILKPDEALSETRRTAANDWYFNTLLSRLNSKQNGVIILVMQRLHEDDLVGKVLEREPWEILRLPAIAQEDEGYPYHSLFQDYLFQRKAGDALHPERDSLETLEQIRQTTGEYNFESQYQQNPIPREGNLIKREWLHFYDLLPSCFDYTLQSWDTASKSDELNDYSVGTTWGVSNQRFHLIDVCRKKLNYPQLKIAVVELYQRFSPDKLLIEDKSSGTALIQELRTTCVHGVESYCPPPGSDKQLRFAAQAIKFEAGKVLLPRQALWLDEYVREITGFPGGKYDDQVDSTSQALHYLTELFKSSGLLEAISRYGNRNRIYETC